KDGLASDMTKFIFQDSKGFYWLGFDNGFQKFDGKNFVTTSFNNKYIDIGSLNSPGVMPVEDGIGNVYVLNQGAIYGYGSGGKLDTIKVFDFGNDDYSDIYSFCKDDKSDIWFVSAKGMYKYDKVSRVPILWSKLKQGNVLINLTRLIYDNSKKCFWLAS